MARRRTPLSAVGGSADEVEARFYEALQRGDLGALMALWADDEDIVCVHPSGRREVGPAAVRASFEAIFANGPIPVRPERVRRIEGAGCAVHHLSERVEVQTEDGPRTAWVMATNVYLHTPAGWRLLVHHASAGGTPEPEDGDAPSSTLH